MNRFCFTIELDAANDAYLMFVVVKLDLVEVSSKSCCLHSYPALIQPGLQLLTVMEELKQLELSLQLLPPDIGPESEGEKRRKGRCDVKKWYICICIGCAMNEEPVKREGYLLLQRDTRDLY